MKCNIIINVDYVKITFVNRSNWINICDYKYVDVNSTVNIPVEFLEDADETCVSTSVGTLSSTMLTIPVTTENITVTLTNAKAQVNVDSLVPYHITNLSPAKQYAALGESAEVALTYETGYTASDLYATLGQVSNGVLTIPVPQDAVRMFSKLYRGTQATLELGVDSTSTCTSNPTANQYKYGITQQLYTADELGVDGVIRALSFKQASSQNITRNIDIYLENVSTSELTEFKSISQATLVYSGQVTFAKGEWKTITLDNSFEYNSSSNLLVTVIDNTGTYGTYVNFPVYKPDGDSTVYARYIHRDSEPYDPNSITSYSSDSDISSLGKPSIKVLKDNIIEDEPDPEPVVEPTMIPIHDTSTAHQKTIPINIPKEYSYSEQIYLANEINAAGTITKIAFHHDTINNPTIRNCEIYMMHTDLSAYPVTSGSGDKKGHIIPVSSNDLVFSGEIDVQPNWTEFELTTPFEYDGIRNLCILMYDKTGSTYGSTPYWYTYNVSDYTSMAQNATSALDETIRNSNTEIFIKQYKNAIRLYMFTR